MQNPTDGTPVVVKNLLVWKDYTGFYPMLLKTLAVLLPLRAEILALVLGAGLAERVGLLPALMVKMASHVNARYASYMVLFIAFFSHISSDAALVIIPPDGCAALFSGGGQASSCRFTGCHCRRRLRLYG
ncbi:AbgT family transporter [Escherichia coli]